MTDAERTLIAIRLFEMNKGMRELRDHVDAAAKMTGDLGESGLALATHLLSEAIGVYMEAVNRYATRELSR